MKMSTSDDGETVFGRFSTACNQRMHDSIVALCYYSLTQHHYNLVI
jgi:hypothetical protein